MEIKQVIVMRKDLGMRKGKMIAQGAHASMKVFLDKMSVEGKGKSYKMQGRITANMAEWSQSLFTKIVVSVNSEEDLLKIYQEACDAGIPCALITDAGRTEFNGVPTKTCCAIGPDASVLINKITGELPLL